MDESWALQAEREMWDEIVANDPSLDNTEEVAAAIEREELRIAQIEGGENDVPGWVRAVEAGAWEEA